MLENRLAAWSRQELTYASVDHVMGLSMNFHDQKDSAEIIKAIEQAECLNELLRLLVVDLMPAVLDVIISLWYLLYLFDIYAFRFCDHLSQQFQIFEHTPERGAGPLAFGCLIALNERQHRR